MSDNKLFQLDSEVATLSLIFKNPELALTSTGLRFYMYSASPHQIIYQEIEDILDKRLAPDPTLVIASLESKNNLEKAGGKKYIESLLSKDFKAESFEEFVKLVRDSYKARAFLSIISSAKRDDLSSSNVDEYIHNTKKSIEGLVEVGAELGTVHVGDVTKATFDEILSRMENPGIRGHSWGIKSMDAATGGKSGGNSWVIAGRPGSGKSALICNSILTDGKNGVPSLLIEREMRTQELMERLITLDTGIPNINIQQGRLTESQIGAVRDSLARLKKMPIYIDTNYRASDIYYLEGTINKFKNQYGIEVVYIDYIQLLAERDETQTQEIGKLTRMCKLLSNELNICTVLLSQLNRNVEARENKRPVLSDMKQSGSIEEDADYAVGLYRDEYYNAETKYKGMMEYILLKNRSGPVGTVALKFDGPTNRITEA